MITKMKFATLVIVGLLWLPSSAQASWISSIEIFGWIEYSGDDTIFFGGPDGMGAFVPNLDGSFSADPDLANNLNNWIPTGQMAYYGAVGIAYEIDLDLPDDGVPRNWWLEWELSGNGELCLEGCITIPPGSSHSGMQEFVGVTQSDLVFGQTTDSILDLLNDIPLFGTDPDLGFFQIIPDDNPDGDPLTGTLYAAAFDDILPFDGTNLEVGGELTLTAHPVPEPATLVLFGTGLCVVAWLRRRRM